jgi:hypothetical protein
VNADSKQFDQLSDKETERRATDALRRALSMPYKSQASMVGKVGRSKGKPAAKRAKSKSPKSR